MAKSRIHNRAVFVSLCLLLVLTSCLAFSGRLSPTARAQDSPASQGNRGKQTYLQGTSPSGKDIVAYLGDASLEVPGSSMACANCHGLDGIGKTEGGVNPLNLTWEALTKPNGLTYPDGRRRPAYTERGLELAITRGLDAAGHKLLTVMPRYRMSQADLADLVVYLKRLGKESDPGISADRIVIGTAIPTTGPLAEMGQAVKAVTSAYFAELNSQGGVYNRRLELKSTETAETPAAASANIERLLKDEQIFAMTGAFIAGAEKEIVPLMAQQEVPLVGPLTLNPQIGLPLNRQVFYLLSGIGGQARALVNFVAGKPELKSQVSAVLYLRSELNASALDAIKDQSKKKALSLPQAYDYGSGNFDAAATAKQLKANGFTAVFFMGSAEDLQSFMTEAEKLSWFPTVFLWGYSVGTGIFAAPAGFDGKVFFSLPTSPADQTAEGIKDFRALAEKYKLPAKHRAAQLSAYSAAKILVEGLRRAGKDVSREKLIHELEGLHEFATGLMPPMSYGPNRRIGAMGGYIVTVDLKQKQFVPASSWININ